MFRRTQGLQPEVFKGLGFLGGEGNVAADLYLRGRTVRIQHRLMTSTYSFIEQPEAGYQVFYSPVCLKHDTGPYHPERRARLESIFEGCKELPEDTPVHFVDPPPADRAAVLRVHTEDYLLGLEKGCEQGDSHYMSRDNPISEHSCSAILASGGLSVALGDHLARGGAGFALNRPPGHHASRSQAEGFCFLNNMALTIETIRVQHPAARFLVVDFDVHHGNGVQNVYIEDPSVYFYSIHGSPRELYPGTGYESERGVGKGEGFTRNVTVSRGTSGEAWLTKFTQGLEDSLLEFIPDFLLACAGFDAHEEDPYQFLRVGDGQYRQVLNLLHETAAHHCQGRLGFTLEGGYSTEVLGRLVPDYIRRTGDWRSEHFR